MDQVRSTVHQWRVVYGPTLWEQCCYRYRSRILAESVPMTLPVKALVALGTLALQRSTESTNSTFMNFASPCSGDFASALAATASEVAALARSW